MRKKWILAVVLALGLGLVAQASVFVTNGVGRSAGRLVLRHRSLTAG